MSRTVEARHPPVGRFVEVGPGRLHYVETAPDPARTAVLLIHGGSGNHADPHLALAAPLAAAGFRVLAFDRPGHGYSDRLDGAAAASPRKQAARLREAAQNLGIHEAIVVVHSLSGVLGLAMALDAPAFVRGLVLLAPVSHPWRGGISWYYTLAAIPVVGALVCWTLVPFVGRAMAPAAVRSVFAPGPVPPGYVERTGLLLLFRPKEFRANAQDFVALHAAASELAPRYAEIAAPVAIVAGALDAIVYPDIHARPLAREIAGATLALLPGVGHSPHYAAQHEVVAAIANVESRAAARAAARPAAANL